MNARGIQDYKVELTWKRDDVLKCAMTSNAVRSNRQSLLELLGQALKEVQTNSHEPM